MQKKVEKLARIFSRRHKQTTFSDAVFLGALRAKGTFWLDAAYREDEEKKGNFSWTLSYNGYVFFFSFFFFII